MPARFGGQSSTGSTSNQLPNLNSMTAKPLFKSGELEKVIATKAHDYRSQDPNFHDQPRNLPGAGEPTSVMDAVKRRLEETRNGSQ
jgi:hypothetical protein